ncbi:MAG: response regulator [Alphaproteobacteria bacterium]
MPDFSNPSNGINKFNVNKSYLIYTFKKYQAMSLVFCIGTIISIIAFTITLNNNMEKLEENFRSDSRVKTLLLENQFQKDIRELELLADLFTFAKNDSEKEFRTYLSDIVKKNEFTTILWITDDDLKKNHYEIASFEPGDKLNEYKNFKPRLNEVIKNGIDLAYIYKKPVTTNLFSLVGDQANQNDIAFVFPIFRNSNPNLPYNQKFIKGFIIGIVNLEEFFEETFRWKNYVSHSSIKIFDKNINDNKKLIYSSEKHQNINDINIDIDNYFSSLKIPFIFIESISLPSREWKILFYPTEFYIKTGVSNSLPWIILLCGMFITLLIGVFWFYLIGRNSEIRKLVSERTEELELAKQILEENQRRLAAVFNNLVEGIITIDVKGIIRATNPAVERMFGYSKEELLDKNISLLLPDNLLNEYNQYLRKLLKSIKNKIREQGKELIAKKQDGSVFQVEVGISTVKIAGEIMFIAILRDITERKLAEKKLAEYANELENERNKAELANKAKSEFLANMSHEIRTPMNSIIGMTELLLDTRLNEEQMEYLNTIHSSGNMLLTIINDILDLSKIEAGQLTLDKGPLILPELISEIIQLLFPRAQENNIDLIVDYHPSVPTYIIADSIRVRQILINLIGNAIKFSRDNYVLIKVSAITQTTHNVNLMFEIQDKGIGINHDKLDKIFKNFTQADESTTRKFGGTGLGLAICKNIVRLMGGTIGAKSEVGIGSTFWFSINVPAPEHHQINYSLITEDLKDKQILFLSNNEMMQNIVKEYFNYLKLPYISLNCIDDTENILPSIYDNYTYLIIDGGLKDDKMDIKEFGYSIKRNLKLENLKLIFITTIGSNINLNFSGQKIFDAYLQRPIFAFSILEGFKEADKTAPTGGIASDLPMNVESLFPQFESNILVVEDYAPNQRLAKKMLEKYGCKVDIANGGEEALEILENKNYDIVFMDCQMPNMDGYEATREIRKSEKAKKVIIIAMTANALIGDKEKCLEAGMDDYIAKPMKQKNLEKMLIKWVEVRDHMDFH